MEPRYRRRPRRRADQIASTVMLIAATVAFVSVCAAVTIAVWRWAL